MFSFSRPRAIALLTVGAIATLGFASGTFGTFSATLLSGHTCSAYEFFSGFGYGYNCTANSSGGGGGGGSSSYTAAAVVTQAIQSGTTTIIVPQPPTGISSVIVVARDIGRSPYRQAITTLISRGLINNQDYVYPNRYVSRAEFMKILANANGFTPVTSTKKFADVDSNSDLAQYIYFGVEKGWVNSDNENFRPNDPISQGEITKLINAIQGTANANTRVGASHWVIRGKAMQDIVAAFFAQL